ncbi:MAG: hypothetical protein PUB12_11450 [[Clostridium] aminophilum]|uniref:hypothetical protein n=1 Tax=[Clostridium] aminophilum TaxID=1526 RepID=UPI0026F06BEC|nr:hypothetical protein [[Clostridium] aminophilum]MDD6197469.1 hypothetical protein [[Clostridium] aminophilum]
MKWKKEETNCSEIPNNSDTISRQAAIDALDKRFDSVPMEQTTEILLLRKDLRELPSVQLEKRTETHVCDCISRQAAIDAAKAYWYKPDIAGAIEQLPSVQPERKTGHWITKIKSNVRGDMWPANPKCSECGGEPYYSNTIYNYEFCPYCGAKMRGEEDGKSGCNHPVGEDKDPYHE